MISKDFDKIKTKIYNEQIPQINDIDKKLQELISVDIEKIK